MTYDNFTTASFFAAVKIHYTLELIVSLFVSILLICLKSARIAIQVTKAFYLGLQQGYTGLTGESCPLACEFACTLPEKDVPLQQFSSLDLESLSATQLKDRAKKQGITGFSRMNKCQLIQALEVA